MVAATDLELNTRYSGHYRTKKRYSAQGTARREFTVVEGAHNLDTHKHGPVIRVLDHGDDIEKTWYLARLFDVEGIDDNDNDTPLDNALEEGVPVRINRADNTYRCVTKRCTVHWQLLYSVLPYRGL